MNEISKTDREYLQDLLSGKKKTNDRHINYALAAIREKSAMASQLQARHVETAKALESMRGELIALNAEINAKGLDVLEFSKFGEGEIAESTVRLSDESIELINRSMPIDRRLPKT